MKADLTQTGDTSWYLKPENGVPATLVGHDREKAINYAIVRGCTKVTEWRDGKKVCDHVIPKKTLGKGEA